MIYYILAVKKAGHLNEKKQKWLVNNLREYLLASQSERVPQGCFMLRWPAFLMASIVITNVIFNIFYKLKIIHNIQSDTIKLSGSSLSAIKNKHKKKAQTCKAWTLIDTALLFNINGRN